MKFNKKNIHNIPVHLNNVGKPLKGTFLECMQTLQLSDVLCTDFIKEHDSIKNIK